MSNYIIEDGLDFFAELKKSLIDKKEDQQELCLLSKLPLLKEETFALECGHKFNYTFLFKEIKHQKCNNFYNTDIIKLGVTQIKCPYCRNVQEKILPYIKGFKSVTRVRGVTSPPEYEMSTEVCNYIFKSGKRKGQTCGKKCIGEFCITCKRRANKPAKKTKNVILDLDNIDLSLQGLSRYLKKDLIKVAKHLSMKKYSTLKKEDLIKAIHEMKK